MESKGSPGNIEGGLGRYKLIQRESIGHYLLLLFYKLKKILDF